MSFLYERSIVMGKYIINKTKTGYTFGLKAANGEVIATGGEVYSSLDSVRNGVKSVETNAPEAAVEDHTVEGYQTEKNPKFEIYSDKAGHLQRRRNGIPRMHQGRLHRTCRRIGDFHSENKA